MSSQEIPTNNLGETAESFDLKAVAHYASWAKSFINRYFNEHKEADVQMPSGVYQISRWLGIIAEKAYLGDEEFKKWLPGNERGVIATLSTARAFAKATVDYDDRIPLGTTEPDVQDPENKQLTQVNLNRLATGLSRSAERITELHAQQVTNEQQFSLRGFTPAKTSSIAIRSSAGANASQFCQTLAKVLREYAVGAGKGTKKAQAFTADVDAFTLPNRQVTKKHLGFLLNMVKQYEAQMEIFHRESTQEVRGL